MGASHIRVPDSGADGGTRPPRSWDEGPAARWLAGRLFDPRRKRPAHASSIADSTCLGTSAERLRLATGKNETCNPCSFEHSYGGATSVSPLIYRRDADFDGITDATDPEEELKIRHRIWVPGNNNGLPIVVIEQGFEIYTTNFYGEPAPDNFPGSRPDA